MKFWPFCFLDTGMTLAEARILFEVARQEPCFADDLQRQLDLDAGFLSRVLGRFEDRGWIRRVRHQDDRRRRAIRLSLKGLSKFEQLDQRQCEVIQQNLQRLDGPARHRLTAEVTTAFLRNFKPGREQCSVAEVDGQIGGSVFLTDEGRPSLALAPAVRRAVISGSRHWRYSGGELSDLRPFCGICKHDALDSEHPRERAAYLRKARIPDR
jgi:DNA-binding MarR family transcriptional regulator